MSSRKRPNSDETEAGLPATSRTRRPSREATTETNSPFPINRLAYKIEEKAAKTLKSLILLAKVAERVRCLQSKEVTALLISCKDLDQMVRFLEWTNLNDTTRQLIPSIRIMCGTTGRSDEPYKYAKKLVESIANDLKLEEIDMLREDSDFEPDSEFLLSHPGLQVCLKNGIYCAQCDQLHKSFVPQ